LVVETRPITTLQDRFDRSLTESKNTQTIDSIHTLVRKFDKELQRAAAFFQKSESLSHVCCRRPLLSKNQKGFTLSQ